MDVKKYLKYIQIYWKNSEIKKTHFYYLQVNRWKKLNKQMNNLKINMFLQSNYYNRCFICFGRYKTNSFYVFYFKTINNAYKWISNEL